MKTCYNNWFDKKKIYHFYISQGLTPDQAKYKARKMYDELYQACLDEGDTPEEAEERTKAVFRELVNSSKREYEQYKKNIKFHDFYLSDDTLDELK